MAGKWPQYWDRAAWYCDLVGRCEVGHVLERGRVGWWEFIVVVVLVARLVERARVVVVVKRRVVRLTRSEVYVMLS